MAKTFGEGDSEKGNRYFSLFVYVSAALDVLFAVLGIIFVRPVARLLGAQGDMLEHAVLYARIILIALPFYILQLLFQSFLVTAEKPKLGLTVTGCPGLPIWCWMLCWLCCCRRNTSLRERLSPRL